MNLLYATFAMKTKPDDTINRIAALERHQDEVSKKLDHKADKADTDNLAKRLHELETKVNSNHESRISALELEIKGLKESMAGMGQGEAIDGAAIMLRINMLNVEINKKIDITVVNQQMSNLSVNYKETLAAMSKQIESNFARHNADFEQLRAEFEHHKNKDFAALENRVAALEKKMANLA